LRRVIRTGRRSSGSASNRPRRDAIHWPAADRPRIETRSTPFGTMAIFERARPVRALSSPAVFSEIAT